MASNSVERPRQAVRVYKLSYTSVAQGVVAPKRLNAVTECAAADGPCSEPIVFKWGNPDYQDETQSIELAKERVEQYRLADLNGDGRLDFIWTEKDSSEVARLYVSLMGTDEVRDMGTLRDVDSFRVNDFNLDGLADIAHFPRRTDVWHLRLTRPALDGGQISFSSSQPLDNNASPELVADLNTDGMLDTYQLTKDRRLKIRYGLRRDETIDAPNRYGFDDELDVASIPNGGDLSTGVHAFGDFNGDGIVDIVVRSWDASATPDGVSGDRRLDVMLGLPNGMYEYWQNLYAGNRRPLSVYVGDINGDGLSDLIYQLEGDEIDYSIDGPRYYRLSTGTGFTDAVQPDECDAFDPLLSIGVPPFGRPCYRVDENYGLSDVNGDGYLDFYFHILDGLYYKPWNAKTASFGGQQKLKEIDITAEGEAIAEGTDWEVSRLADMNGDGVVDIVTRVKGGWSVQLRPPEWGKVITEIGGSSGPVTQLTYQTLGLARDLGAYTSLQDTASNLPDYYEAVNSPFAELPSNAQQVVTDETAPVMETLTGASVVVEVSSSAPISGNTDAKQTVRYRYGQNLMQLGGQGLLGFRTISTVDQQTQVETKTTYRQDWPFIGRPLKSVVTSKDGATLSESSNVSVMYGFAGAQTTATLAVSGSTALGPIAIYDKEVEDKTYNLVGNGTVQGELIATKTMEMEMDEYGNATRIVDKTEGAATSSTTVTINDFGDTPESQKQGRLAWTTVTQSRESGLNLEGPLEITRRSEFTYYSSGPHKGMLLGEYVNAPESGQAPESVTLHSYDQFGNEVYTSTQGLRNEEGANRISPLRVYDELGRYVTKTFNVFNEQLGPSVDDANISDYQSRMSRLDISGSIQRVSQVEEVDAYLRPLSVRHYVSPTQYYTSRKAYTPLGNQYFSSDDSGAYSVSLIKSGIGEHCPEGTYYHELARSAGGAQSITCYDVLGRPQREAKQMLNGRWAYTDTRYNLAGKVALVTEPTYTSPQYQTEFTYDLLGRTTQVEHPDNSVTLTEYDGFKTITTDPLLQTTTKTTNVWGELIKVVDDQQNTIIYRYRADGNLGRLIDPAGNETVMDYDEMGRKIRMSDPDRGVWRYGYNALGELVCQQDAEKKFSTFVYDAQGRKIRREARGTAANVSCSFGTLPPVQESLDTVYDTAPNGMGQIAEDTSSHGLTRRYIYDHFGRTEVKINVTSGGATSGEGFHYQKTLYDRYSRPWISFDAARNGPQFNRNGVQNHYNEFGYLKKITEVTDSETVYYNAEIMDARGNMRTATLGGGAIRQEFRYEEDTGRRNIIQAYNAVNQTVQDVYLQWDEVGNLDYREDRGMAKSGRTRYLKEDYNYDSLNRLDDYTISGDAQHEVDVQYDEIGNITFKTGVGVYQYNTGSDPVRPHAVNNAGGVDYRYNANGNLLNDDRGRVFDYNGFERVSSITKDGRTSEFYYGPDLAVFKRVDHSDQGTTTTLYLGDAEKVYHPDGTQEWRRLIGGVALVTQKVNSAGDITDQQTRYLLKDHLGSIQKIVNDAGVIEEEMAFDPWGKRRNLDTWEDLTAAATLATWFIDARPITSRGFTGHKMVDEMGIIHMGGRIYDPTLGRFLQADPIVQSPSNTASLNRYSYAWNNPLNAVDPSGFSLSSIWDDIKPYIGIAVATVMTVFAPAGAGMMYAAFTGAASSTVGAIAMGVTSGKDIMRATLTGAVTAAAFYGVGSAFDGGSGDFFGTTLSGADYTAKVLAHGMVGGVMSVMQDGKFGHGFISAGLSQGFSGKINGFRSTTAKVIASATLGGVSSEMTGGKFRNGAQTAAFVTLFNHGLHEAKERAARKASVKFVYKSEGLEKFKQAQEKYGVTTLFEDLLPPGEHVIEVSIDASLSGTDVGMQNPNAGTIKVNPDFLETQSLNTIGSAIGHELVHVNDHLRGDLNAYDSASINASERKAYQWNRSNAKHFDLGVQYKLWATQKINEYQ